MAGALSNWAVAFAARSELMPSLLRLIIQSIADPNADVSAIASAGLEAAVSEHRNLETMHD